MSANARETDRTAFTLHPPRRPYIKAIKEALKVPVLANGDIRSLAEAHACLEATGADGVLSAEPLLSNPALFSDPPVYAPPSDNRESTTSVASDQFQALCGGSACSGAASGSGGVRSGVSWLMFFFAGRRGGLRAHIGALSAATREHFCCCPYRCMARCSLLYMESSPSNRPYSAIEMSRAQIRPAMH